VALLLLAGAGAALWVDMRGSAPANTRAQATSRSTTTTRVATTTSTTVPPTTTTLPATTTTLDPGTLPQTSAFPPANGATFEGEMSALWQGIVTGNATAALPAFFPKAAYGQLKEIENPASDYTNRLVAYYSLDIAAAHAALGPDAAQATLVSVDVDESFGHWIPPGVCANSIGYFEVPNSRIVYQVDGQTRSFGIASMISWRGVWYVVHLGAILRSGAVGMVEDPETGPGSPTPSSTC
jgi:hypothetical protein